MTDNKRKHLRIDALNLLSYACLDDNDRPQQQGMGRTLNVSENGILIETHTPLEPSGDLSISIGLENELVELRGKVIHARRTAEGVFEIGVTFMKPDDSSLQILKKYITAFQTKPASGATA